jgi:hypothetical protein
MYETKLDTNLDNNLIWFERLKKLTIFLFVLTLILSVVAITKDKFNNYKIFHQSFLSLIQNLNLYALHPDQHFDYYKYSPTFAMLMAPLAFLPLSIAGVVWNFLNVGPLIYAFRKTQLSFKAQFFSLLIILPELIGTVQNFQSNALLVALMLFCYSALEEDKHILAAVYLALAMHIKFFVIIFLLIGLLYKRPFKFILWSLFLTAASVALPLLITGADQFNYLYSEWGILLQRDADSSHRLSIFGIIERVFGLRLQPTLYQLAAGLVLAFPFGIGFLQRHGWLPRSFKALSVHERINYFSIILIWLMVFNHMSEGPTYIIGMVGFAIWYTLIMSPVENKRWVLYGTLILTSLFYSDLVPSWFKVNIVDIYVFKVWPFILIYVYAQTKIYQSLFTKKSV